MAPTPLAPPKLSTTTHTGTGTSVIASSGTIPPFFPFGPERASFAILHTTLTVPASNTAPPTPAEQTLPRCPPNGTMFCTTDFPPGASAPMHRTQSLDYACVLAGEITLTLDGGDKTVIRQGECIVQRGTNHSWVNNGEGICRLVFVMVGSEKVKLENGDVLEETIIKK